MSPRNGMSHSAMLSSGSATWADAIKAGDFDGSWCGVDGEAVAEIEGHEITFPDGHVARLDKSRPDMLCMIMDGEVFSARLNQPGILRWNDGDVWVLSEAKEVLKEALQVPPPSTPSSSSTATRSIPSYEVIVSDAGCYRVLQGVVFKKPGGDPRIDKGLKKVHNVGSTLTTTGRSWRGPNDSEWVELDCTDSPGWVLVQGEGVGMPGPLLQKVEADEETPFILRVNSPKADESYLLPCDGGQSSPEAPGVRNFVMKPSSSMREVKAWISLLFKLNACEIRICKPQEQRPSNGKYVVWHNLGKDEFVSDDVTISEAGFTDGCLIQYIYTGFLAD